MSAGVRRDDVEIVPGFNRWLVGRTDRDGVSAELAMETAVVVVRRWLQEASPLTFRSAFSKYPEAAQRYAIGAARPVELLITQAPPELVRVPNVQRFEGCKHVRVLRAERPWFLVVNFMWHGSAVRRAWPRRSVNAIGVEDDNDQALDWLLFEAAAIGEKQMEDAWHKSA